MSSTTSKWHNSDTDTLSCDTSSSSIAGKRRSSNPLHQAANDHREPECATGEVPACSRTRIQSNRYAPANGVAAEATLQWLLREGADTTAKLGASARAALLLPRDEQGAAIYHISARTYGVAVPSKMG